MAGGKGIQLQSLDRKIVGGPLVLFFYVIFLSPLGNFLFKLSIPEFLPNEMPYPDKSRRNKSFKHFEVGEQPESIILINE